MVTEPRAEEHRVRNAGDAREGQHLRTCRFVVRDAVRDRAVQADIVTEGEMALAIALHHNQPAFRFHLAGDAVSSAIPADRIHKYALVMRHRQSVISNTELSDA